MLFTRQTSGLRKNYVFQAELNATRQPGLKAETRSPYPDEQSRRIKTVVVDYDRNQRLAHFSRKRRYPLQLPLSVSVSYILYGLRGRFKLAYLPFKRFIGKQLQ